MTTIFIAPSAFCMDGETSGSSIHVKNKRLENLTQFYDKIGKDFYKKSLQREGNFYSEKGKKLREIVKQESEYSEKVAFHFNEAKKYQKDAEIAKNTIVFL